MGKRAKLSSRCFVCRMHTESCICADLPSLTLATRVVLVMHRREYKKTTNTGVLALRTLPNSALAIWGEPTEPPDPALFADGERRALVLTPSDDAATLTPALAAADPRPVTLVVPDGTWRQANKMPRRVPALADLPRVRLAPGPPTRYRLREETHPWGLATFEAIARALGVLEGLDTQRALEDAFDRMVEATLDTRGRA